MTSNKTAPSTRTTYRGRFAPSPTGHLHFGSLVAAVASFLDAKSQNGTWLVRIEDIDPPREMTGATQSILKTLEAFHLYWDEEILYQSQRTEAYQEALEQLKAVNAVYLCQCSRKDIQASGGQYLNTCRNKRLNFSLDGAVRVIQSNPLPYFFDRLQTENSFEATADDFIVLRRDGLFAYQLAVVVDDITQNISDVVRGLDIIDSTPKQLRLYQLFGKQPPSYLHLPLVLAPNGQKFSKQNLAPALPTQDKALWLIKALNFLGQAPITELKDASLDEVLNWATQHWSTKNIPVNSQIINY